MLGTKFLGTVGIILVATQHRYGVPTAAEEIKELLRARHRIHSAEDNDFTIRTMEDVANTVAGASRTMLMMLLSIASISPGRWDWNHEYSAGVGHRTDQRSGFGWQWEPNAPTSCCSFSWRRSF